MLHTLIVTPKESGTQPHCLPVVGDPALLPDFEKTHQLGILILSVLLTIIFIVLPIHLYLVCVHHRNAWSVLVGKIDRSLMKKLKKPKESKKGIVKMKNKNKNQKKNQEEGEDDQSLLLSQGVEAKNDFDKENENEKEEEEEKPAGKTRFLGKINFDRWKTLEWTIPTENNIDNSTNLQRVEKLDNLDIEQVSQVLSYKDDNLGDEELQSMDLEDQ